MVTGLIAAEIQPRGEGNVLGFEEMLAEREGIAAEGAMQLEATIQDLSNQMLAAASELKFELAGRLRDEVQDLKKELRQMSEATK